MLTKFQFCLYQIQKNPKIMSSSCELVFPASAENPNCSKWRFTWEAQSHTSILRLIVFNPNIKPCAEINVKLSVEKSLLTLCFAQGESIRVPVPRVLIDPEAPVHCRVFDDHVEVKLALLLPVDHPLISGLDLSETEEEKPDSGTCFPFSVNYGQSEMIFYFIFGFILQIWDAAKG